MQVPYFLIFLALWIASIVLAWPVWLTWVLGVLTFLPLAFLIEFFIFAGVIGLIGAAVARRRY